MNFDIDLKTYKAECVQTSFGSSDGLNFRSDKALKRKIAYPPGRSKASKTASNPARPIINLETYFGTGGIP